MGSAIVIGAGIGGLAAAARLANAGYRVTLLEKNAVPGGRTTALDLGGYRFDVGPTFSLMPAVFAETYRALGERMEDHLDLVRLDPAYRVHFHDGSKLDLSSNLQYMREQLDALEPGAFGAYLRFLAEGYRHYRVSLERLVGRNFYSLGEYFSLRNLPLLIQLKALITHYNNTSRFFRDPRLWAAFSFQNMYLGVSPFEAPATFSLLQYVEAADGVWFPKGGLYEVILSLARIAEKQGVRIEYNAPVEQIVVEGNQAKGVTLADGRRLAADLVVANADLPYVYSKLLPDDGNAARLAGKKYTSSALMFYWAVRGARSHALLHHNAFLADHQFRRSFEQIFDQHTLPEEPSFYILCTHAYRPELRPTRRRQPDGPRACRSPGRPASARLAGPAGAGARRHHRTPGDAWPGRSGRARSRRGDARSRRIRTRSESGKRIGFRAEPQFRPAGLPPPAQCSCALPQPVFRRRQHPSRDGLAHRAAVSAPDRRTHSRQAGGPARAPTGPRPRVAEHA